MNVHKNKTKMLKADFGDGEDDSQLFELAARNWMDKLEKKYQIYQEKEKEA